MNDLIKEVSFTKFSVALYQTDAGYIVKKTTEFTTTFGPEIYDYHLASYMFDLAIQEAQGN